jgi:DNA phosphorothioation-dependent restriction protein DptF
MDVHTLVRTFYIFREFDYANNYHRRFEQDFSDSSTLEYVKLIIANQNYSIEKKPILQAFYKEIRKAIFAYANKHNPSLTSNQLLQCDTINGFGICSTLKLSPAWSQIEAYNSDSINNFKCFLNVDLEQLEPITISLSMYKLILAINQGYRPNKHDRNTIIIFEELLEKIFSIIKQSDNITFIKNDKRYSFTNTLDEIEVNIHD